MERTCVIIKPDGIGKKVVGEIIKSFESEGLKLLGMKMVWPDRSTIENFYDVHRGKYFFEFFINFMTSGPIIVTAWEGENAVFGVRNIIGSTDSMEAAPGTLRRMFGTDGRKNLVHASDSVENGIKEIKFFFKNGEIIDYSPEEWKKG
ncbi:MAG: nucleoside-diphosphate kinase [Elusimicrobia bacterium]|nr:nucleoside-diphosphate kinase [Elusimicrobiota bacterium]